MTNVAAEDVTARQAAEILGCSVSTVIRLTKLGELPGRKIPGLRQPYLFRRSDVLELKRERDKGRTS